MPIQIPPPAQVYTWACEICGEQYTSIEHARECEAKGSPKKYDFPIGTPVRVSIYHPDDDDEWVYGVIIEYTELKGYGRFRGHKTAPIVKLVEPPLRSSKSDYLVVSETVEEVDLLKWRKDATSRLANSLKNLNEIFERDMKMAKELERMRNDVTQG